MTVPLRMVQAADDAGHSVHYRYNADGMLTDVISSSGRERYYSYDRSLMTQIADEKQHVLLHNWYESGRLVRQQVGEDATYSYKYRLSSNKRYVEIRLWSHYQTAAQTVEVSCQHHSRYGEELASLRTAVVLPGRGSSGQCFSVALPPSLRSGCWTS